MNVKLRQELERRIAKAAIDQLLAAGFTLGVNDGEDITIKWESDQSKVLAAMFTTDEDWLLVYNNEEGKTSNQIGWVRFVYGNDGYDVICDYTVNVEPYITEANKIAEQYS